MKKAIRYTFHIIAEFSIHRYTMENDFSIVKVDLGTCKIKLNPIRVIMDPEMVVNGVCVCVRVHIAQNNLSEYKL